MAGAEQTSWWRRWFGSTGAPPQTSLVTYLICGGAAGAGLGAVFVPRGGAVLAALTGALVAAAGAHGPSRVALRVAGLAAVMAAVFVFVAFVVSGSPWWAAAAIAVVAVLTSAMVSAGPVGAALSQFGLLIYFLAVVVGTLTGATDDVSLASGALRIVLGAAAGLAVVAVGGAVRDRRDPEAAAVAPHIPSPWPAVWASLRSLDEHTRDGVRRAIPLTIGMYLFQRSGSRDAFWMFLAAFVVLMPAGKSPARLAAARVVSTLVGVVMLGVFALVLPDPALVALALVAILLGVAYQPTYPLIAGGLAAMGAVLLVGAPAGDIGGWAGHRLLDTAIGCALALGFTYLLWPRDRPDTGEDSAEDSNAHPGEAPS